ncbi:HtaA domain-containing protein [Streptomyces sp. NPDC060243]|uniref:HtaA domain-containing protein n=1 Tax=Streptomyces sp. NPDC060243 TaxID=3347081 RepID=UPI00364EB239
MAVTRRRKTTVLAAAVATAAALGTGALTLPTASAAPRAAGAPTITLKDGTLDWGVKESFRKYLLSPIAHGKITTGDGATQADGNGPFTFTGGSGTYDTGSHGTHTAFNGSVRFEGHEGVLDIELSDLQVTTTTTGGGISADVTNVADGKSTTDQDVVIADLSLDGIRPGTGAGGAMVFTDIPATLTADGSKAFQGFYQAGAALDAATLSVTADSGKPSEEPTTGPTDEPTTGPTDEPTGKPTDEPSGKPSEEPSGKPSEEPSGEPTGKPGDKPGDMPGGKPSETPAGSGGVAKGALTWGLKESWRKYIATGGGSEVSGGAKKSGDVFTFPYTSGTADADAEKTDAAFGGGVRFTYKAHGIDMEFSDVKVVTSGTKGTLTLDVTTPQGTKDDVDFAKLDLSSASYAVKNDVLTLDQVPAAFTAAGAAAFANDTTGSLYKAGDALDPVTVSLALSDDADLPAAGSGSGNGGGTGTGAGGTGSGASGSGFGTSGATGSLASTGAGLPTGPLLGGAAAVVAAGAGALYAARRRRATEQA